MQMFPRFVPAWFACALVLGVASATAATSPPKLVSAVEPEHPPALFERGIGGSAKVTITIAADGSVADAVVAEATAPALGEAAVAAVKQWQFEPARREGEPVAIKVSQRFDFPASIQRTLTFLAGREVFISEPEEVWAMDDLRKPPAMTAPPAPPIYPARLAGSGKTASVPLTFLINPEGVPVNPQVVAEEGNPGPDLNFQLAALRALLSARWEPPVRDGRTVYARGLMTIDVEEPPEPALPAPSGDTRPGPGQALLPDERSE